MQAIIKQSQTQTETYRHKKNTQSDRQRDGEYRPTGRQADKYIHTYIHIQKYRQTAQHTYRQAD